MNIKQTFERISRALASKTTIAPDYTPHAKRVLVKALEQAEQSNQDFADTEHVLATLLVVDDCLAVKVLQYLGVKVTSLRQELKKHIISGTSKPVEQISFSPRMQKVLKLAEQEAKLLFHKYVGTEHLLLGLLGDDDGIAASMLKARGLDVEETRQVVMRLLDPNFHTD